MNSTRPSYAAVVSTIALAVALAGGGAAVAGAVGHNSVGSAQIKNGSITGKDVKRSTLTGAKVKDDTLTGDDIVESTLSLPASSAVVEGPAAEGTMTSTEAAMASATFVAPANGYVLVTGSASFNAGVGSRYVQARLYEDTTVIQDAYWDAGDIDGVGDQRQDVFAVAPVSAGPHVFKLTGVESLTSGTHAPFFDTQVIVEFFPTGSASVGPFPD